MFKKKKKILHVVGGGFNQLTLVKTAKELGLEVLVTDYYDNPPCKEFADHFEKIDTTDKELTLEAAKKYNIDYIVTDQTDVAIPTVAYVADMLGLKGIGYNKALAFTNKYIMRKSLTGNLQEYIPENYYFDEIAPAIEFCKELTDLEEYLVKPINSQGSKGVNKLNRDYIHLIKEAFHESKDRGIIIEKFISGFEFSVEAFVKDYEVYNLALTKKYHYAHNSCLDERNTYLGDVDESLEQKIFEANTRIVKELGLPFGSIHAEYKVEKNRVYLMEIAARGAGGSINSHIIPFLTGFNPTKTLLRILMDEPVEIVFDDYKKRFAVLRFFNFSVGKIKKIYIDSDITKKAMVFTLDIKEGDTLTPIKDSRNRSGYFVVAGEDREDVLKQEKMLQSSVSVEYDNTSTAGVLI